MAGFTLLAASALILATLPFTQPRSTTPDPFLAIKCRRIVLFNVPLECARYFERIDNPTSAPAPSASPTSSPSPPPLAPIAYTLAGWAKGVISLISSLITVYGGIVAFLRYVKKLSFRQSLCLGFYGRTQGTAMNDSSVSVPLS